MPRKELDPRLGAEMYDLPIEGSSLEEAVLAEEASDGPEASDVEETLQMLMREAVDYYTDNIEPDQVEATEYYMERKPKRAGKGRSSVVSTDVRDAVRDRLPDLIEIFAGSDSPVEFRPEGPEDELVSRQQTDYIRDIYWVKNPGFLNTLAVLKDAETRRLGWLKWWWEDESRVEGETHTGLTEEDLQILGADEDVDDYEIIREYEGMVPQQDPQTGAVQLTPGTLYDCEVKRTRKRGRCRVEAVPPEEIVFTPYSRSLGTAQLVAHTRETTRDELVLLGIDEDLIEENVGRRESDGSDQLDWARQVLADLGTKSERDGFAETDDESQAPILFTEAYAMIDADGDGIAELRMFQLVGPDFKVNPNMPLGEMISHRPLALFNPEPEPHTMLGLCTWDHMHSIQDIKTDVSRAQLNSLSQSVDPQLAITDKIVNLEDVLNPEVNSVIRVRGDVNSSIREIKTTFVGEETLAVLQYYDVVGGERLGSRGPSEGLDPNILQSTTREAVGANLSKGQRQLLMAARAYAEIGFATAFKGILMTVIENQDYTAVVRLRNEWVEVDPRSWHAERDVQINVALGTGSKQEQIEALTALAEKQEAHVTNGSPLGSWARLRNTYARLTDLLGYRNTDQFWPPFSDQDEQAMREAQAQQQPPPDAQMALVEVERERAMMQNAIEQERLQLEQWKAFREDDLKRDKLAQDGALKEREIEAKFKVDIRDSELRAQVEHRRAELDADVQRSNQPATEE